MNPDQIAALRRIIMHDLAEDDMTQIEPAELLALLDSLNACQRDLSKCVAMNDEHIAHGAAKAMELAEVRMQLVAAEKDAARWRHITEVMGLRFSQSEDKSLEATNAAIDAAIATQGAKK